MSVKLLVLYPNPKDPEQFDQWCQREHLPMRKANLAGATGLAPYRVLGSPAGKSPFARLTEVTFPSLQAVQQCAALPGAQKTTCQALANAGTLTSSPSGTFKAWLGDSTGTPATRFTQSSAPYITVLGTVIANDWTDLTDGTLAAPIDRDEFGTLRASQAAWTDVNASGTLFNSEHCGNWTSNSFAVTGFVGTNSVTNSQWTAGTNMLCNGSFRLYCFEQ